MPGTTWTIVASILGILLATIGSLVLARLVFVSRQIEANRAELSSQIERNRREYKDEFASIWETIKSGEAKCNGVHSTIAADIGFIKAKLEDIITALAEQKKDLWDKADRQTEFMRKEKDDLLKRFDSVEVRMRDIEQVQRGNR
jgi:hypothetical protein